MPWWRVPELSPSEDEIRGTLRNNVFWSKSTKEGGGWDVGLERWMRAGHGSIQGSWSLSGETGKREAVRRFCAADSADHER